MKRIMMTLLLALMLHHAQGQILALPYDSAYCNLIFPAGREYMEPFYRKLQQLYMYGTTGVNILHIGGSHVQAGDLSHRIRTRLTEMRPRMAADRGLLFPFRAMKTNGPFNYGLSYTGTWKKSRCVSETPDVLLGLAGAAAMPTDSTCTLTLTLREDGKWNFAYLRILGEPTDINIEPYVITRGDTIFSLPPDGKPGYLFEIGERDSTCQIGFVGLTDSSTFILRGLIPETGRYGVTYTESGINGAAVPSWLRCSSHLEEELRLMTPDLIIFGIGINDANVPPSSFDPEEFKENYRILIGRLISANPDCALLFITNNDCWINVRGMRKQFNPNTEKVRKAMTELAEEYAGCVFDVYGLMGGFKSSQKWIDRKLMKKDHIHFTREGYFLVGDLLSDALINDFHQWLKNK